MKNLTKLLLTLTISSTAFNLAAEGPGADWGNPYDLYIGGVTYSGSGITGHSGTHGSTVTGASWSICNDRLQTKKAMHNSAGDSLLNEVPCYLKTTVLFEPQIAAPNFDNNGSGGGTTVLTDLDELKARYNIKSYQQKVDSLRSQYNIDSFRAEYEKIHQNSLKESVASETQKQEARK